MRRWCLACLFALAFAAGRPSAAPAGELSGTLKLIKDSGLVVVGHRESSVPFSYYDIDLSVIGYSQEYAWRVVEALKRELDLPDLKVKFIPITSQNRIPLLQNGTYDFECGSTSNTAERREQVDFSDTIFIVGTRFLVHKDSGVGGLDDLKGRTVAVTSGTTSEKMLSVLNDEKKLGLTVISAKDHGDAFRTVESGRAVAFFIDDALLAGERAKADKPDDWLIVGDPLSYEAYACMSRKGDEPFKKLLDETVAQAQSSGLAEEWFAKWFTRPIPPRRLNLKMELSDKMRELFAAPNDRPLD